MANYRRYSVRAGMNGRMIIDVPLGAIKLRGERNAVLQYAFDKLMGYDDLMRLDKKSVTRKFLIAEINSRYFHQQKEVFELFCSRTRYSPMCNVVR